MKTFKYLKEIKNRDSYAKLSVTNYANTLLDMIGRRERVVQILPTEIINMNLENKFTDIRCLTDLDTVIIFEGHSGILRSDHLERYFGYLIDSRCEYSKKSNVIILCFSEGNHLKKFNVEENICFKPQVIEFKKIDGDKYLNKLRVKFRHNVELDHYDCAMLVHLPLLNLSITPEEYVHEICGYIKNYNCIPEDEKSVIIPAMYLNIHWYIDDEFTQEKLLGDINMIKYCENGLDREKRLAREDEAKKVTENFACNLLRDGQTIEYVHKMCGVDISRIKELKANL